MKMLESGSPEVLAWTRTTLGGKVVVVACNFSAESRIVSLENALGGSATTATTLASSGGAGEKSAVNLNAISLAPYGSIIAEVN